MHIAIDVLATIGLFAVVAGVALYLFNRAADRGWNPFE